MHMHRTRYYVYRNSALEMYHMYGLGWFAPHFTEAWALDKRFQWSL